MAGFGKLRIIGIHKKFQPQKNSNSHFDLLLGVKRRSVGGVAEEKNA
jgi:hypothetical protein